MKTGIYKITNIINKKCYIGLAYDIEQRWQRHKNSAFNLNSNAYNYTISKALRKHGLENFNFEILEICSIEELNEKEIFYIKEYNSFLDGYNSTVGGTFGPSFHKLDSSSLNSLIYDLINTDLIYEELQKKYNLSKDFISDINTGKSWYKKELDYPLRKKRKYLLYVWY